jgi:hypothetical protein
MRNNAARLGERWVPALGVGTEAYLWINAPDDFEPAVSDPRQDTDRAQKA